MLYKTILLWALSLCFAAPAFARQLTMSERIDSLYRELDAAILKANEYVAERQRRIDHLHSQLKEHHTPQELYDINFRLFEEYTPFVTDSAINKLFRCVDIAEQAGWKARRGECLARIAYRCSSAGMYDESRTTLQRVDFNDLDSTGRIAYYRAYHHLCSELSFYAATPRLRELYNADTQKYEQLLIDATPADDDISMQVREQRALNSRNHKESFAINEEWLKRVEHGSHRYALVAFYRYLEINAQGRDKEERIYWLLESSLSDVRNGVMDQGSMWELCNQLIAAGYTDRSYNYISFASHCASRFGSRQRNWRIAPLMSEIADKYKQEADLRTQQLTGVVWGISILALCLIGALFYVNSQRKKLSVLRRREKEKNLLLEESNTKLSELNGQLHAVNSEVQAVNDQLSHVNNQLKESNRMRDEYVGRFMRLCTLNIDKMEAFRKQVNRMVKNREFDALYQLTRDHRNQDQQLDAFYEDFDKAFLHLFPTFIAQLNAMIKPEERMEDLPEGTLNTKLRIFALIRLGIDDSGKIAEFLHYSANTIYNYRARMKNAALEDRSTFEDRVRAIRGER